MAIEITNGNSRYQYRICPDNPCLIERRENKGGRKWKIFRYFTRAVDARDGLLKLEQRERERGQG